jgi:hypothetical protein
LLFLILWWYFDSSKNSFHESKSKMLEMRKCIMECKKEKNWNRVLFGEEIYLALGKVMLYERRYIPVYKITSFDQLCHGLCCFRFRFVHCACKWVFGNNIFRMYRLLKNYGNGHIKLMPQISNNSISKMFVRDISYLLEIFSILWDLSHCFFTNS